MGHPASGPLGLALNSVLGRPPGTCWNVPPPSSCPRPSNSPLGPTKAPSTQGQAGKDEIATGEHRGLRSSGQIHSYPWCRRDPKGTPGLTQVQLADSGPHRPRLCESAACGWHGLTLFPEWGPGPPGMSLQLSDFLTPGGPTGPVFPAQQFSLRSTFLLPTLGITPAPTPHPD